MFQRKLQEGSGRVLKWFWEVSGRFQKGFVKAFKMFLKGRERESERERGRERKRQRDKGERERERGVSLRCVERGTVTC